MMIKKKYETSDEGVEPADAGVAGETLVMKFGGASVATPEHFALAAKIVAIQAKRYQNIAVVVSAMGDTTDKLIALAREVHPNPPSREYDMLVTVGERISIALLAMALDLQKISALSFTGSQSGIITCGRHTDARIMNVKPHRISACLKSGKVAIVAGFQGVSVHGEITTLGRGGSDTTAVALGVAFGAEVEFYKDVSGIFTEDPKKNPLAELKKKLSYAEALAIGGDVLHPRCLQLAERNGVPLRVRSFTDFIEGKGEGTLVC